MSLALPPTPKLFDQICVILPRLLRSESQRELSTGIKADEVGVYEGTECASIPNGF